MGCELYNLSIFFFRWLVSLGLEKNHVRKPHGFPVEDIFSYHAAMSACLRAKEWHRCIELCNTMRLEVRMEIFSPRKNPRFFDVFYIFFLPRVMRVDG